MEDCPFTETVFVIEGFKLLKTKIYYTARDFSRQPPFGGLNTPVRSSRAAVFQTRAKGASATSNGVRIQLRDKRAFFY